MKLFNEDHKDRTKNAIKVGSLSLIGGVSLALLDQGFPKSGGIPLHDAFFVIIITAYVLSIFFAQLGISRFKQHNANPSEVPLIISLVYFAAAALLAGMPSYMSVSVDTIGQAETLIHRSF